MAESAEEIYARVVATVGEGGRLPAAELVEWEMFPWEVADGALVPKVLQPPLAEDRSRHGENGVDCGKCEGRGESVAIWENDAFQVTRPAEPGGSPMVLFLETREHVDFPQMDDAQAAEYGRITVWLTRIIEALDNIGRVHVNRWGDGSAHMHVWFIARPARLPGVIGGTAWEWTSILPAVDRDTWLADCATVARKLANHGGRTLA